MDYNIGHSNCSEGAFISDVDAFVCLKCGRVEFYAKKEIVDKRLAEAERKKEIEAERERIDQEIALKQKELSKLEAVAKDENQTVKAVREAEERIAQVKKEIDILKAKRPRMPGLPGGDPYSSAGYLPSDYSRGA